MSSGLVALTDRMKSGGRPCVGLVPVERLEGAGEDDAAEIPEHCSDHDAASLRWATADPSRCRPRRRKPARRGRTVLSSAETAPTIRNEKLNDIEEGPSHVVVDGSNIATEGRSLPSLAQLSEAVMSFMEEHPERSHHRRRRCDLRAPHRQEGSGRVRGRHLEQRTRRPAGRSDRSRRCVRPVDRPEGECVDPVERLVPGVPRRLRVAVRRGPADRRQAGAARRLGVRRTGRPCAGPVSRKATQGAQGGSRTRGGSKRRRLRASARSQGEREPARQRADAGAEVAAARAVAQAGAGPIGRGGRGGSGRRTAARRPRGRRRRSTS